MEKRESEQKPRVGLDWENDHVSERVAQIIVSYADYVDRFVWHKK